MSCVGQGPSRHTLQTDRPLSQGRALDVTTSEELKTSTKQCEGAAIKWRTCHVELDDNTQNVVDVCLRAIEL